VILFAAHAPQIFQIVQIAGCKPFSKAPPALNSLLPALEDRKSRHSAPSSEIHVMDGILAQTRFVEIIGPTIPSSKVALWGRRINRLHKSASCVRNRESGRPPTLCINNALHTAINNQFMLHNKCCDIVQLFIIVPSSYRPAQPAIVLVQCLCNTIVAVCT
jgi:hypothetical protein